MQDTKAKAYAVHIHINQENRTVRVLNLYKLPTYLFKLLSLDISLAHSLAYWSEPNQLHPSVLTPCHVVVDLLLPIHR